MFPSRPRSASAPSSASSSSNSAVVTPRPINVEPLTSTKSDTDDNKVLGFWASIRVNLCSHPIVLALLLAGLCGPSNDLAPIVKQRFGGGAAMVGWANSLKHGTGIIVSIAGVVRWMAHRYSTRTIAMIGLVGKAVCFVLLAIAAPTPILFHMALAVQVSHPPSIAYLVANSELLMLL